jgi:two-component system osmolarity sensor histidine kinase EnvZ
MSEAPPAPARTPAARVRRLASWRVWARLFKRRLPTTLWGRALLIIVLPVALMQVAVTWEFFDLHWQTVTARLSESLAGDIAWATDSYKADPTPENLERIAATANRHMKLSVALQPGKKLPPGPSRSSFAPLDRSLQKSLAERVDEPFWFDTRRYPSAVDIRVQAPNGVLRFIADRDRAFASSGQIFVFWLLIATVLLTAIAVLFIRNQVRAIERLATAAKAFGKGIDAPDFKPYGALEVRQAAHAFLDMRERIQRHIEQRTALLASVSHDLRTPLTRLKLEFALAEPSPRLEAMKRDLAEMEHMIDEYLAFARGQAGEAVEMVGMKTLIEEVGEGARRVGAEVEVTADANLAAAVRPNAMRRALSNLVMNAAAHGERVRVAARTLPSGGVEIAVDDDGPGIPPERYEEAFRPFSRLDEARNQNVKGVGLGLAIARDVARGHGGEVTLERSVLGGLRAVVRLPG